MLLLDALYAIVLVLVSPWLVLMILIRPGFRAGLLDRFRPALDSAPEKQTVWLHGSSAGEIELLRALVEGIESLPGDYRIVISAFAVSGHAAAEKVFANHTVIYLPIDFSPVLRRFLRVVDPQLIVLVESELWPNLIAAADQAGIPVCLVNARMSEKSFRVHRKIPVIPWALKKLSMLAVQSDEDAARFRALGFPDERLHVTGNMKYDLCDVGDQDAVLRLRGRLREGLGIGPTTPVLIGGSVHRGEDKALVQVYKALADSGRDLRLIVVPRYTADAESVVGELEELGLIGVRRSELTDGQNHILGDPAHVLVVDTMGELKKFYAMSDIAYVGGSLHYRGSNKGGHNLMEPAVLGLAIIFGPHNYSFRETVRDLLGADAGVLVHDQDELRSTLEHLLDDPQLSTEIGHRARNVILGKRGAAGQNFVLLRNYLSWSSKHPNNQPNEGIQTQP